ncbi:VpaChn25_0724 family phage protein [Litorisediminicola beolgyonensis]|uniref:ArsR family transcriptional regulator n=1 Tax=Litorisediminicola beolgyonensis TaxID=1173614 RepID=A0ABW3ZIB5_9RHOB
MPDLKTITEHRRLAILRHLASASTYTSNTSILHDVVNGVGVSTSRDQLIAALSWLHEQELLEMTDLGDGVVVATATGRGVEVATGAAEHPGVRRPSPRG